jgi:hypothetical protein
MQVRLTLDAALRREEFVDRAQLFPAELVFDVEPHVLSVAARDALAQCNPDLPDVFDMLSPDTDRGADADAGRLWAMKFNPNSYAVSEVVEIWAKEFLAARPQSAE